MSKPAFLVDGIMEKNIVEGLCPGAVVRVLGINGKSVSLDAIAKKATPLIKLLARRSNPIILLIDRETRTQSSLVIEAELSNLCKNLGCPSQLIVGVADRMIENWILADWDNLTRYIGKSLTSPYNATDGLRGKSILKEYIAGYQETIDGVSLFLSSSPAKMFRNSPSFRTIVNKSRIHPCDYIHRNIVF